MTNAKKRYRDRDVPTDQEIEKTLRKSEKIPSEYFRKRVRALIGLVKKFGKRRAEVGTLKISDLEVKENYLYVTFTLRKKHKKGLFQFIKYLKAMEKKTRFEYIGNKSLPTLEAEWKQWQQTEFGYRVKEKRVTKNVIIDDKYAKLILEYVDYLKKANPSGVFLFPSGKAVFSTYVIDNTRSLSGSQLLRILKPLNHKLWLHLFREMKGAEISRDLGMNLNALAAVKQTLDLENEETAWHYVERYAVQTMKPEIS